MQKINRGDGKENEAPASGLLHMISGLNSHRELKASQKADDTDDDDVMKLTDSEDDDDDAADQPDSADKHRSSEGNSSTAFS